MNNSSVKRPKLTAVWLLVFCVFFLDQLSKFLISLKLKPGSSLSLIKNIFSITLVHNTGAAFGVFKHQTFFFISISFVAITCMIIYIIRRKKNEGLSLDVSLALVLGGALGNLLDRVRFGYVVDFLDFKIWPVFNLADSAITIGAFLLILSIIKNRKVTN